MSGIRIVPGMYSSTKTTPTYMATECLPFDGRHINVRLIFERGTQCVSPFTHWLPRALLKPLERFCVPCNFYSPHSLCNERHSPSCKINTSPGSEGLLPQHRHHLRQWRRHLSIRHPFPRPSAIKSNLKRTWGPTGERQLQQYIYS